LWLAVAALCEVVRTFWKTVAAVVAISSEFLFLLKPEDDNLELAEFSHGNSWHAHISDAIFAFAHQIHDHLVDLVDGIAGDISKNVGVEVSSFFS